MAFISGDSWTSSVIEIANQNTGLNCAVAFLGEKSIELFKNRTKESKIICNLDSGATNPYAIEALLKLPNVKVRNFPKLHAKVYCTNKTCIVGSGNISANGLSFENSELDGWVEAGIISTDSSEVKDSNNWFNRLWNSSSVNMISNADLDFLKKIYLKRRNNRFNFKTDAKSLFEILTNSPEKLKNTRLYITRCTEKSTKRQDRNVDKIKKAQHYKNNFDAYIGFSKKELPIDAFLINFLEYGNCVEIDNNGIYRNFLEVDSFFHELDGEPYWFVAPVYKGIINNNLHVTKNDLKMLQRNYWLFQPFFKEKEYFEAYKLKEIVSRFK